MPALLRCLFIALSIAGVAVAAEPVSPRTLEWTDLIPEDARDEFPSGPAAVP